jgi:hypothetical protein
VNIPGQPPVFKYTSHAWLLDLFFDCPAHMGANCALNSSVSSASGVEGKRAGAAQGLEKTPDFGPGCVVCPNASLIADVRRAVVDDVITWHAFPFNAEPELADKQLFADGIKAVHALDVRGPHCTASTSHWTARHRSVLHDTTLP